MILCSLAGFALMAGHDSWRTEIVFQGPLPLTACAVGDVEPLYPGDEILVASQDGGILMLASIEGEWRIREIASPAGEVVQIVTGEMDDGVPGEEIALVCAEKGRAVIDQASEAWCLRRTKEGCPPFDWPHGWDEEWMYTSDKLLRAVAVLGPSVIVAGHDRQVTSIERLPERQRRTLTYADLPGAALMAGVIPEAPVFACANGALALVEGHPEGPQPILRPQVEATILHQRGVERTALSVGEDGRILVGDMDGTLTLIETDGSMALLETVLLEGRQPLRGVALADLDPDLPGLEAAAAGDGGELYLLSREGSTWRSSVVLVDSSPLLSLASGDLGGDGDQDLVVCGASGTLFVVDLVGR